MYRIKWQSIKTGATGQGRALFSYDEAKNIANSLNSQPDAVCVHSVELAPDDKQEEKDSKPE